MCDIDLRRKKKQNRKTILNEIKLVSVRKWYIFCLISTLIITLAQFVIFWKWNDNKHFWRITFAIKFAKSAKTKSIKKSSFKLVFNHRFVQNFNIFGINQNHNLKWTKRNFLVTYQNKKGKNIKMLVEQSCKYLKNIFF